MKESDFVKIELTVPETHANAVREAIGKGGAGKIGHYSYCSFSVKGMGRFRPDEKADPFIGQKGMVEAVPEEKIETICHKDLLGQVLEAIKQTHPYEEPMIDIRPFYRS